MGMKSLYSTAILSTSVTVGQGAEVSMGAGCSRRHHEPEEEPVVAPEEPGAEEPVVAPEELAHALPIEEEPVVAPEELALALPKGWADEVEAEPPEEPSPWERWMVSPFRFVPEA